MLSLTREVGQKIVIGDDVVVTVIAVSSNGRVRLGIEAPKQVRIDREEVLERVRQANRESASTAPDVEINAEEWAAYGSQAASSAGPEPEGD